jgi:predicted acetyltransferase
VDRVLMNCDETNAGSRAVIEACGGKLDGIATIASQPTPICRYWID